MTETTNRKPLGDQIANMAFTADNGGHIDTIGTIILGIILLIVLFAYMRAQGRNRHSPTPTTMNTSASTTMTA